MLQSIVLHHLPSFKQSLDAAGGGLSLRELRDHSFLPRVASIESRAKFNAMSIMLMSWTLSGTS